MRLEEKVDVMESKSEFVRLEEFVDNLLIKYKEMKERCTVLEISLEEREAECTKLKETISELRSERSVVGEKVSGLIDRIEQWEKELEAGELSEQEDLAKLQGKLFQGGQAAAK